MTMHYPLVLALLLLTTSCISTSLVKFPTFDEAMEMPGPETPLVGQSEEFDASMMPLIIHYASIHVTGEGAVSTTDMVNTVGKEAARLKLHPDVILMSISKVRDIGMTRLNYGVPGNTLGFGVWGWLYRVSPSCFGFRMNKTNAIISISESSHARKTGLQEGDILVSVNGAEVDHAPRSKFNQVLLGLIPGEEVDVVWNSRDGSHSKGRLKMISNPKDWLGQETARRATETDKEREHRLWKQNDF